MEDFERLRVIGIQGAMSAGKTTIRDRIVAEHGGIWIPMAGPLKRALVAMGATAEEIYGDKKAEPNELWGGKTNRFAQQTIGTEWGRKIISQDIWVNCVGRQITEMYGQTVRTQSSLLVVIDDVRFPNEAQMVRDFGGELWTVRRPEVEYAVWKQRALRRFGWRAGSLLGIHESERWWAIVENNGFTDAMIWNHDKPIEDLAWFVDYLMQHERKKTNVTL